MAEEVPEEAQEVALEVSEVVSEEAKEVALVASEVALEANVEVASEEEAEEEAVASEVETEEGSEAEASKLVPYPNTLFIYTSYSFYLLTILGTNHSYSTIHDSVLREQTQTVHASSIVSCSISVNLQETRDCTIKLSQ